MQALNSRSRQTGEPVAHIVMSSLADTLEVNHSTLFQVSTSTALVEGVYGGVVTIGELKQHGSFGFGTFDGLDGEMLGLDGHFYQVLGDGTVREARDDAKAPFAVVTEFRAERELVLDHVESFDDLSAQLDRASAGVRAHRRQRDRRGVLDTALCANDQRRWMALPLRDWRPHRWRSSPGLPGSGSPGADPGSGRYPHRDAGDGSVPASRPQPGSQSGARSRRARQEA